MDAPASLEDEDDDEDCLPRRSLAEAGGRLRGRPLSPNRDFGEIQFLVADVDNAVVLEKEVSA